MGRRARGRAGAGERERDAWLSFHLSPFSIMTKAGEDGTNNSFAFLKLAPLLLLLFLEEEGRGRSLLLNRSMRDFVSKEQTEEGKRART